MKIRNDGIVEATGTQPVSGPLTDTQLRATAVPVSGPLTDTQLRATAVPVSGTVSATGANLTYGTPTQVTVGAVAGNLIASTSGFREVTIKVAKGTANGIFINANGTATSAHFQLDSGDTIVMQTAQAISAIRAGLADTTVYIMSAT